MPEWPIVDFSQPVASPDLVLELRKLGLEAGSRISSRREDPELVVQNATPITAWLLAEPDETRLRRAAVDRHLLNLGFSALRLLACRDDPAAFICATGKYLAFYRGEDAQAVEAFQQHKMFAYLRKQGARGAAVLDLDGYLDSVVGYAAEIASIQDWLESWETQGAVRQEAAPDGVVTWFWVSDDPALPEDPRWIAVRAHLQALGNPGATFGQLHAYLSRTDVPLANREQLHRLLSDHERSGDVKRTAAPANRWYLVSDDPAPQAE